MAGGLYICATPIGNLQDITLRVLEVLKQVDLILAEDTRHTRKLLNHFEINTPLRSLHEHNEYEQIPALLAELAGGASLALVSDAGLPAVSDPGALLIQAAREQGYPVTVLPGASAVTTALLLSGLSSGQGFSFIGFLPRTSKQRQDLLRTYAAFQHPVICFESPHRLQSSLEDFEAVLGTREVAVCRELTKLHEEVIRFALPELRAYFAHHPPRGELTLVIAPAPEQTEMLEVADAETVQAAWRELQELGLDKRSVQESLQERFGLTRNELYALLLNKG
ncbi:16S rRNA (cytidine(1402)-2'-O)-methyltransferase [bacterium (Candidatus Blackallbacteria) CG17_big_fil_post_rev_8_21_14_2_50_48_46]|uniref:Ribosomal RNA small subunit methyltransferase I n=1 Tax=bacterium (Candidatus Blackallbacteria) CG17_big_fil_post_rev_8_21_14_2_50_48_46 TaxID=2014261 RepID=A0A2M7GBE4_9BACT|nr:MAG: 16S rRNA (cytidine(1402)-2'-O)-methyltransferase [bacterium (Candidatus Blackallbacteria) CG18_big_fil_WC_8_21_14_2_50_49_26]PIW19512.1 MAG: 16S rRNA (cytidine(1402)-2'-O)-methyltransferase [bacterium (Candidatus Blackallbacteria) CG17_big_fil_post_rev_8_21_14_2_50_48_46]PIW48884.1 MAG: 16S rRNA (cytidine(1402)-2'-O)-methyltransferase [bacterium (Candidatus Blackallbacteria) CG13_big_fil_rev_8_21_14_2_50_49_14]